MEAIYGIPDGRLEVLQEKVAALNKRALKLGVVPLDLEVLCHQDVRRLIGGTERCETTRWHWVRLTGETPKLAGWSFRAVIEPHETGNVLRVVPGHDVPELYRACELTCDHCRTARRRKETYVVRNEADGRWAQVGSGCVRDFLGGADPHRVAGWLELIDAFGHLLVRAEDDDDFFGCGRGQKRWPVEDVLLAAALAIRKWGWLSRSKAEECGRDPTSAYVARLLDPPPSRGREVRDAWRELSETDREDARAALAWARGLTPTSTFESNLKIAASDGSATGRELGLLCAAIPCWARACERELNRRKWERLGATSTYQGEVKKRREFEVTIASHQTLESDFGLTQFYKFVDDAGNLFVWFGSRDLDAKVGDAVVVRATVKKHEEYRGVRQTVLTRVDLLKRVTETA